MSPEIVEVTAEHQHVLCRLFPWESVFGGSFSADTGLVAPDQEIGRRDRCVVLEVVTAGPGNVSRGTLNPCTIKEGDIVVANLFHRSHTPTVAGHNFSLFNWENIMAKIDIDEVNKGISMAPLQAYLICQPNEERAHRFIMGKSMIMNPGIDMQVSGGDRFDERGKPKEQTKTVVEEVVQVGPGAVVDGMWQEPPNLVGDLVMYDTSVAPVRFMVQGAVYTLIHWRHVLLSSRTPKPEALPENEATH